MKRINQVQELRMLILDAVEAIEIHVRSQLAYHFSQKHGAFSYLQRDLFPGFNPRYGDYERWVRKLEEQMKRSRTIRGNEDFVRHFFQKYGDIHNILPIWMAIELMDFGSTLSFYRGVEPDIRKRVAASFSQPEELIGNWLLVLNSVRNRCAHHARLWNWTMGNKLKLPNKRKYPEWYHKHLDTARIGTVLLVISYLLGSITKKIPGLGEPKRWYRDFRPVSCAGSALLPVGMTRYSGNTLPVHDGFVGETGPEVTPEVVREDDCHFS